MNSQCKLCMKQAKLIKAHIIPQFLFGPTNFAISSSSSFAKNRPTGTYDVNILCQKCDGDVIGVLDNTAKKILIDRRNVTNQLIFNPADPLQFLKIYRLSDKVGYAKIARFFISILWRASVSSHEDFVGFSLGSYESIAKKAIMDPLYDFSAVFSVALCLLPDLSQPYHCFPLNKINNHEIDFYSLIIGYYKVFIKCDDKPLSYELWPTVLSPKNDILMMESNFSGMPEYKSLIGMVENVLHHKNLTKKKRNKEGCHVL